MLSVVAVVSGVAVVGVVVAEVVVVMVLVDNSISDVVWV